MRWTAWWTWNETRAQAEALDKDDFPTSSGLTSGKDQDRGQLERHAVSVTDKGMAGGRCEGPGSPLNMEILIGQDVVCTCSLGSCWWLRPVIRSSIKTAYNSGVTLVEP